MKLFSIIVEVDPELLIRRDKRVEPLKVIR